MEANSLASRPVVGLPLLRKLLLLTLLPLCLIVTLYYGLPRWMGVDWVGAYRPAALAMLSGQSPYDYPVYNAPWALLPFVPLALLPPHLGYVGTFILNAIGLGYIAWKLSGKRMVVLLFLTSYPAVGGLVVGGLDWLPMLSFVLPAPIGLIFAAMKPQIGLGISLYWLVESWRTGSWRGVLRTFLPVALLLTASFLLYGPWLTQFPNLIRASWNASLFPYELPIGLYLLWAALSQRRARPAMACSPFLSPYHTLWGLQPALVGLLEHPKLLAIASACLWSYVIVGVFA